MLISFLKLAVLALFILTALGFLGQLHWFFELIAPFRLQYLIALGLLSIIFGALGHPKTFFLAFMGTVINGWLVLPVFFETAPLPPAGSVQPIRLMQINLSTRNSQFTRAIGVIQSFHPDVVAAEEITADWYKALCKSPWIRAHLPYRYISVDSQLGVFSRFKFLSHRTRRVNPHYPTDDIVVARLATGEKPLEVIVVHPQHPTSSIQNWRQMVTFSYLIANRKQFQEPFVIMGDLNTTPWSHHFIAFLRQMMINDSRTGFGIEATWPAQWWPLLIPIDHVLLSPDVEVLFHQIGPFTGSDHRPVIVTIGI